MHPRAVWRPQVSGDLREVLYNTSQFTSAILVYATPDAETGRRLVDQRSLVAESLFEVEVLSTPPQDCVANLCREADDFRETLPLEWNQYDSRCTRGDFEAISGAGKSQGSATQVTPLCACWSTAAR